MRYVKAIMCVDGRAQSNPGPGAAGVITRDEEGEVIGPLSEPWVGVSGIQVLCRTVGVVVPSAG